MFLRNEHGLNQGGGAGALSFGRLSVPAPPIAVTERLQGFEFAPDLGVDIGSRTWWRGFLTCTALIAATMAVAPMGLHPLTIGTDARLRASDRQDARGQAIAPLALGATSGTHATPGDRVRVLADTPERPVIETSAVLGADRDLPSALVRAGVGDSEAARVATLIADAVPDGELSPGTRFALTLGQRSSADAARPLEKLGLRARFDLAIEVTRDASGALTLVQHPIAVDDTPLRIEGRAGPSLYRAARAAGAPARAVEAFIKAIATRLDIADLADNDRFDLVVAQQRAATGETKLGDLLFAGLDHDGRHIELLRWGAGDDAHWYGPEGVGGQHAATLTMPLQGRITSGFGMREHPVLGLWRMHDGIDIAAPWGSPIHASADGVVVFAGSDGGYGNFVKIRHADGLMSGYGHMSRIAAQVGEHVRQGDVVGYEGSTGLSTGPHVHWEIWKDGTPVDPRSVGFATVDRLSGSELASFKAQWSRLTGLAVATGTPSDPQPG